MTLRPAPARQASHWLDDDETFRAVRDAARRLLAAQRDLDALAPSLRLRVLAWRGDELWVDAPNAAMAARLRQTEPSLREGLRDRGWQVSRIRYRSQPGQVTAAPAAAPRRIPAAGLAALAGLRETIAPDHPMQRALADLLRHHGGDRWPPR